MYWSSSPQCNAGACANEGLAWDAWQENISGPICNGPTTTFFCKDVYQRLYGVETSFAKLYNLTIGTSNNGNCSIWQEPHPATPEPTTHPGSHQTRRAECPAGYQAASIDEGPCYAPKDESCSGGNPIQCSNGRKTQLETDIVASTGDSLGFTRYYSSTGFYSAVGAPRPDEVLGSDWHHNWQSSIVVEASQGTGLNEYAYVVQPNGDYRHFQHSGGAWVGRTDKPDRLEEIVVGDTRVGWVFTSEDNSIYRYDGRGVWLSLEQGGLVTTLTYSDASTPLAIAPKPGLLIRVMDSRSRTLDFRYDGQSYLKGIIDSAGREYGYRYTMSEYPGHAGYNTGTLRFADRPGGGTREYRYDEPDHAGSAHFNQLTGVIDENGQRFGTYKYDAQGRAYQEYHGSGNADLLTLSYGGGSTPTVVINALGQAERRSFVAVNGIIRDAGRRRCTDGTCSTMAQESLVSYASDGNPDLVTDFNGNVTDYDYNTRGLEVRRVEASTAGSGSAKRTTETQWHATFNVPLTRRIRNSAGAVESMMAWAYNSRGQETARCEMDPSDSSAMAYTCSASAVPPVGAAIRRFVKTYCEADDVIANSCPLVGLLTAVNGPRAVTDEGMNGSDDVTVYAYYPDADVLGCGTVGGACHRKGDLRLVTNALGQSTEYLAYAANGSLARIRDANGTITDLVYNDRGWPVQYTIRARANGNADAGDATVTLVYDNVGQVIRAVQPDGASLNYVYDDAHRLTDIVDGLNNRIHFTLDATGHRIREETFDSSYNPRSMDVGLKRKLSRQYNALGRLVAEFNARGLPTNDSTPYNSGGLTDGYDANGNALRSKDGLNIQTLKNYDALNRLVKAIQDYSGSASATADATTEYAYDARDNLLSVRDPSAQTTTYSYDGFNNLVRQESPDTGRTRYSYDLAGNRISQTDGRGVTRSYVYDALNRIVGIVYPKSTSNVVYYYDEGSRTTGCNSSYPFGRLTRMSDATGITTYCYDRRGNVTRKTQVTEGEVLTSAYSYTLADRIATITYPGGGVASYGYDLAGRPIRLVWKATSASAAMVVVDNISYYPFGPINVLTYGNGRTLTSTYDQDYQSESVVSSAANGLMLAFDRDVMANIASATSVAGSTTSMHGYVYDALHRLTQVKDSSGAPIESYDYNKTGDRLLKQVAGYPQQVYAYLPGTHKLGSVSGMDRGYDLNGNTTSRGDDVAFEYDDSGRLRGATVSGNVSIYGYTAKGERVYKERPSGGMQVAERYIYNESGQLLTETATEVGGRRPTSTVDYLLIDSLPVAVSRGAELSYVETDHLGTPRVAASADTNAREWSWDLLGSAFGDHSATAVVPGKDIALRYSGQYHDSETDLAYNYFRSYEASTGRYLESDPIGLQGGPSTYGYANQNPLYYFDPLGLAAGYVNCAPDQRAIWNFPARWAQGGPSGPTKSCIPRPPAPPMCNNGGTSSGCYDCQMILTSCLESTGLGAQLTSISIGCFIGAVGRIVGAGSAASPVSSLATSGVKPGLEKACKQAYEGCKIRNKQKNCCS